MNNTNGKLHPKKRFKNIIPRSAEKLDVTFLVDTNIGQNHMTAVKTPENTWIGTDDNGKIWRFFAAHLRNGNLCRVEVIE